MLILHLCFSAGNVAEAKLSNQNDVPSEIQRLAVLHIRRLLYALVSLHVRNVLSQLMRCVDMVMMLV